MDVVNNFNKMFGKVQNGMCRLSMNGEIAVKTSSGYKTYNPKTNRLTNCSNFVFDIGEEFFFVVPTNHVKNGDIILIGGKPKCVINKDTETITVINYEDATVETILPERHVFLGSTYFYGKIVSMFGRNIFGDKKGTNKMLTYMMMSEMMKGGNNGGSSMNMVLPMMMMSGGNMNGLFDGMFEFDEDAEDIEETENTEE